MEAVRYSGEKVIQRIREEARPAASWSVRLSGAAVASYLVAEFFFHSKTPHLLLAPLTALLVTQVTLSSIVRHGLDRSFSVILGVGVASLFSSVVGLSWWSLGLLVAISMLIGQMLRVGPNLIEVPISAMLVLSAGVGETAPAATERILETLIGAGVGVIVNILFPPGVRATNAGAAIEQFARDSGQLLFRTASSMRKGITKDESAQWLMDARRLTNRSPNVERALQHAEESRVLNVRAIGKVDTGPALRAGLDALDHCAVATRSLYRGINDVMHFSDAEDDPLPEQQRMEVAAALETMATSISAFGGLIHAQVSGLVESEEKVLQAALSKLNEARSTYADELVTRPAPTQSLQDLNAYVAATLGRILRELDMRGHVWLKERMKQGNVDRRPRLLDTDKLRRSSRKLTDKAKLSR